MYRTCDVDHTRTSTWLDTTRSNTYGRRSSAYSASRTHTQPDYSNTLDNPVNTPVSHRRVFVGAAVQSQLVLLTDSLIITVTLIMLLARLFLAHHNVTGVIFLLHIVFDALTITLVFLTPRSLAIIPIYPIMLFAFAALYTRRRLVIWFTGSALLIATVGFCL